MKKSLSMRFSLVFVSMALLVLGLSSSTSAQVVVGQVGPPGPLAVCEYPSDYDEFQLSVASGAGYTAPSAGVITSWSTSAASGVGQVLGFKVFRPLGGGNYLVVAADPLRFLTPSTLNTFPVNIPVQAGDLIGLAIPTGAPTACEFATGLGGDVIGYNEGLTPAGGVFPIENTFNESRLNVSATLLPPPAISAISPANISIKGGSVTIAGSNFASVTGVSFGSVPAAGFTVNSGSQITAVAPATKTLGPVPVTVTTVAGTATSAVPFTYEGCRVPQLRGKKLKASKKKLRKADCKIGKVKKLHDATAKTGKVVKQSPKPGKILAPGTKVKVTLDES